MPQAPHTDQQHRAILQGIAERAMLERGLLPTFSAEASAELQGIHAPAAPSAASGADAPAIRDLTGPLWASIDNDDSRVVRGFEGVDVGDQIRVQLMSVHVERGFIDFRRVDSARP